MSSCPHWTIWVLGLLICGLPSLLVLMLVPSWPLVLVYLLMFWTYFVLVVLLMVHRLTHQVLLCCLFHWPLILCLVCPVLQTLLDILIILYWCELNWVILWGLLSPVLRLYIRQQSLWYTNGWSASLPSSQLQGKLVMLYQMLQP